MAMWRALAHNTLFMMMEMWQKFLYKAGISGVILTDLSKAFNGILHDLLIAKLAAHGFNYQSLRIMERVFFPIDSKEQKLRMPLVITLKLYMDFRKGQFWVPYVSITISVTYCLI